MAWPLAALIWLLGIGSSALASTPGVPPVTQGIRTLGLQVRLWGDAPPTLLKTLPLTLATSLRSAGAEVVLAGDAGFGELKAQVGVLLRAFKSHEGRQCAWGVDIDLYQPVRLERDESIRLSSAPTFHSSRMGVIACSDLESALHDAAVDLFEEFLRVYRFDHGALK